MEIVILTFTTRPRLLEREETKLLAFGMVMVSGLVMKLM